jgi:arabinogalactan oligomer / maltooligosaccharide transport system permease protein
MTTAAQKKTSDGIESFFVHALLIGAVIFAIYPLLWVVSVAFSPGGISSAHGAIPLPTNPSLDNFRLLTGAGNSSRAWLFGRQLANSILVAFATSFTAIAIATPAAYALARFDFVGAKGGMRALLATQMFPAVASAVPLYLLLDALHLLDSRAGLVLVYASTAVPFAIFQLRGAFLAISVDIEEAAMVDGATRAEAFWKVVLPAARPAIAVTALYAFMSAYNEFILAATLLSRESAFTLPVVLQRYVGEHDAAWGIFAAGAIVVSLPVMALFYYAQRHLVSGLTAGSVKG